MKTEQYKHFIILLLIIHLVLYPRRRKDVGIGETTWTTTLENKSYTSHTRKIFVHTGLTRSMWNNNCRLILRRSEKANMRAFRQQWIYGEHYKLFTETKLTGKGSQENWENASENYEISVFIPFARFLHLH